MGPLFIAASMLAVAAAAWFASKRWRWEAPAEFRDDRSQTAAAPPRNDSSLPRRRAMPLHWFNPPIYVTDAKTGERYAVTNIERAAEFLLSWRDAAASEEWREAVQACMAAIKGQGGIEDARAAFAVAAQACGRSAGDSG